MRASSFLAAAVLAAACAPRDELSAARSTLVVPAEMDFGSVYLGGAGELSLSLHASGTAPVRVQELRTSTAEITATPASALEIAAGDTAAVTLRWQPAALGELSAASLSITAATPEPLSLIVTLRGVALEIPACDDGDPCTADHFDLTARACAATPANDGDDCDDHSLCTDHDVCVSGDCIGTARNCSDALACSRDLCDDALGCTHPVDTSLCDDENPCTREWCGDDGACRSTPLGDGTPCGLVTCSGVPLCQSGSCLVLPAEGLPCSDGNDCTINDVCTSGACAGEGQPCATDVAAQIAPMLDELCVLLVDNRVLCAHVDYANDAIVFQAIPLGDGIVRRIAGGGRHACALLADDTVRCWGINTFGQLGLGDDLSRLPADAPPEGLEAAHLAPEPVLDIALGSNSTCALFATGAMKCWGLNATGQLGLGDTANRGDAPGEMESLPYIELAAPVQQIAASNNHTCALLTDSTMQCWGRNATGELGVGTTRVYGDEPGEMGTVLPRAGLNQSFIPTAIQAGSDSYGTGGTYNSTLALSSEGRIKWWGEANYRGGSEAYGDTTGELAGMATFNTRRPAIQITLRRTIGCALYDDRSIQCWGLDCPFCGPHAETYEPRGLYGGPSMDIGANFDVASIAMGGSFGCALSEAREVRCWGYRWERYKTTSMPFP
jgi:hypothetical protein